MVIITVNDILKHVNSKNIDQFLTDFEMSLRSAVELKEALGGIREFEWTSFEWKNDNVPTSHISIEP